MSVERYQKHADHLGENTVKFRQALKETIGSHSEVIAPTLSNRGLLIRCAPDTTHSWRTLLSNAAISAETLKAVGFVLFENFTPSETDTVSQWPSVAGDNKVQMIHRDHPRSNGVAYFHMPAQSGPRNAYTVLGNGEDVFAKFLIFLKSHDISSLEPGNVIAELLNTLKDNPTLSAKTISPDNKSTWAQYD